MTRVEPSQRFISMRFINEDLPDLIEIETRVSVDHWSGIAQAYADPISLRTQAAELEQWCKRPDGDAMLNVDKTGESGPYAILRFFTYGMARHTACHLQLSAEWGKYGSPTFENRQMSLVVCTEAGLIEKFARDVQSMIDLLRGEAVLRCAFP